RDRRGRRALVVELIYWGISGSPAGSRHPDIGGARGSWGNIHADDVVGFHVESQGCCAAEGDGGRTTEVTANHRDPVVGYRGTGGHAQVRYRRRIGPLIVETTFGGGR